MALVGKLTRRVQIPHEPGEWVELRDLSWRQLEAARNESQANGLATVLLAAIVAWSYDEPVSAESIDQLDAATVGWIVPQVVGVKEKTDEARLEDFLPSTKL